MTVAQSADMHPKSPPATLSIGGRHGRDPARGFGLLLDAASAPNSPYSTPLAAFALSFAGAAPASNASRPILPPQPDAIYTPDANAAQGIPGGIGASGAIGASAAPVIPGAAEYDAGDRYAQGPESSSRESSAPRDGDIAARARASGASNAPEPDAPRSDSSPAGGSVAKGAADAGRALRSDNDGAAHGKSANDTAGGASAAGQTARADAGNGATNGAGSSGTGASGTANGTHATSADSVSDASGDIGARIRIIDLRIGAKAAASAAEAAPATAGANAGTASSASRAAGDTGTAAQSAVSAATKAAGKAVAGAAKSQDAATIASRAGSGAGHGGAKHSGEAMSAAQALGSASGRVANAAGGAATQTDGGDRGPRAAERVSGGNPSRVALHALQQSAKAAHEGGPGSHDAGSGSADGSGAESNASGLKTGAQLTNTHHAGGNGAAVDGRFGDQLQTAFRGTPATAGRTDGSGLTGQLARQLQQTGNADIVREAKVILRNNDSGEIRMNLKPEALGTVRIHLQIVNNHIAGRIVVDNISVRDAFQQNLHHLYDAFRASGFDPGTLDVSVGQGNSQSAGGRSPNENTGGVFRVAAVDELSRSVPRVAESAYAQNAVNLMV